MNNFYFLTIPYFFYNFSYFRITVEDSIQNPEHRNSHYKVTNSTLEYFFYSTSAKAIFSISWVRKGLQCTLKIFKIKENFEGLFYSCYLVQYCIIMYIIVDFISSVSKKEILKLYLICRTFALIFLKPYVHCNDVHHIFTETIVSVKIE
jgi:hypothetical protein